jgi:perosamine synthetase
MSFSPIPVNEPLLDGNEKKYLNQCIETGWISSEGPFVELFESKMANLVDRKHAVAVTNGSCALDMAITALGINKGDEVIMPTFTIISCAASIVRAGAIPVLVDSDPLTWNMDVNKLEKMITIRTKAIMVVHIYGLPVDMEPILALCKKYDLKLIEDAAEAIGLTYKGIPCGSFGDVSTFSFYPNKNITTGEGGMVLMNDPTLYERCLSLRNLCFQVGKRFVHEELGWNMRMTNIQAALGVAQVEKINATLKKKRAIGENYQKLLGNLDGIKLPLSKTSYAENNYWVFGIVIDDNIPCDANFVMSLLAKEKIGTRPFFWSMHEQPVFKRQGLFKNAFNPVSECISRRGFYIPSGLAISQDQIVRVSSAVTRVINGLT